MKILVSAFACLPNAGSEGGVGWRWAMEWAREHEVVVITDTWRRAEVERYLADHPVSNPRFIFYRPRWLARVPINGLTVQMLYQFWQIGLLSYVRELNLREKFNLAHHVTYGVFRQPSLIGHAGIPLVFGPVGGGEDAPWRLKQSLSRGQRLRELVRSGLNWFARYDPLLRWGLKGSRLILAKTLATARALPIGFEARTQIALEIGTIRREGVGPRLLPTDRPLRLLFAGRLLGWKGVHLGIAAVAHARSLGGSVELHIIGDGPAAGRLQDLVRTLGIEDVVHWQKLVPQAELFAKYQEMDGVLFPSLHDSSGNVVVEALSFALPVICLDLGGPADIVTDACGFVVNTAGLNENEVTLALGAAIRDLARDSGCYQRLSEGALVRSGELLWDAQMERIKALALACVE